MALSLLNGLSTFSDRVQTLERVATERNSEFLRFLATGDPKHVQGDMIRQLAPDEFSLWVQEMSAQHPSAEPDARKATRLCEHHLRDCVSRLGVSTHPLGVIALAGYFSKLDLPGFSFSLMRLSDAFARLNALHWTWAGVGPFLGFLRLVDPRTKLDEAALRASQAYSRTLKLSVLFRRLLLLRALGGDDSIKSFVLANHETLAEAGRFGATDAKAWIALGLQCSQVNESHQDPGLLSEAILFQIKIAELIGAGEVGELIKVIPSAYALDSNLVYYLDWKSLDAVLPEHWTTLSINAVLCAALFDDRTVEARCTTRVNRRGSGAFFEILDQLVTGYRNKYQQKDTVSVLLKELGELPPAAARYLFPRISEKAVLDRLPYTFIPRGIEPSTAASEHTSVPRAAPAEQRSTINRLHLIQKGLDANLIAHQRANEILEQERRLLWTMVSREAARRGRIRIDEVGLGNLIYEELSADPLVRFARGRIGEQAGDREWAAMLRDLIAENVTVHILAGENWSFAGTLSSNLKHGVLKPRVLRSFADAYNGHRKTASKSASDKVDAVQGVIGATIDRFMASHLTVRRDDEFWRRVSGAVAVALGRHWDVFQAPTLEVMHIAQPLARTILPLMREYLEVAKAEFDTRVREEVRAQIDSVAGEAPSQFLEGLGSEMDIALSEASSWVQISAPSEETDFEVAEIVHHEIESYLISQRDAMNVAIVCVDLDGDRENTSATAYKFSGRYKEVLREAVHNVLLNAVQHSGLDLDTSIKITCCKVREDLHLICENTFSPAHRERIAKGIPKARLAANGGAPGRAREEKGSGFPKIRAISQQLLGAPPKVVFLDMGPRTDVFTVSVRWKAGFATMAATP